MLDDRTRTNQKNGTHSDAPDSEPADTGDRTTDFGCCGVRIDDEVVGCPCASMMRRHPVVTFTLLTLMGLAVLVIPAGAIMGIIAFLRTL